MNPEIKVPTWLGRILIKDGPLCHLCGLCVDITAGSNYRLSASRDHLIPNPLTRQSGYRKRMFRNPDHELNAVDNILLSHRWCNSTRGQLEVNPELKSSIRERITSKHSTEEFTRLMELHELWRQGILNSSVENLSPALKGRARSKFIAKQRIRQEWKEEMAKYISLEEAAATPVTAVSSTGEMCHRTRTQ